MTGVLERLTGEDLILPVDTTDEDVVRQMARVVNALAMAVRLSPETLDGAYLDAQFEDWDNPGLHPWVPGVAIPPVMQELEQLRQLVR